MEEFVLVGLPVCVGIMVIALVFWTKQRDAKMYEVMHHSITVMFDQLPEDQDTITKDCQLVPEISTEDRIFTLEEFTLAIDDALNEMESTIEKQQKAIEAFNEELKLYSERIRGEDYM